MGGDYTRVSKKLKPGCGRKRKRDNDNFENQVPLILSFVGTPKSEECVSPVSFIATPKTEDCESQSRLETLPMDVLVKTLCHLHHDQLTAVFHVSQRLREAVSQARQLHFNYKTPDRSTQHLPFANQGDAKVLCMPSPHTPKAPTRCPRPPSRLNVSDMQRLAADLFQESAFPPRCMVGLNEMHD